MKLIEQIAVNNPCYRAGKTITPKGLMLHSVGCPQPDASVFAKCWNSSNAAVCVHAVLQADGTVYQLLPWNWRGWHGGGSSNNTHIGVEMTEPANIRYKGGASFLCSDPVAAREQVKGTYETAVELFAKLCELYHLEPLTAICSHAEGHRLGIASNHGDPEHLWKQLELPYTMDTFRQAVKAKMQEQSSKNPTMTAIDRLARLGAINTPAYWYAHYTEVRYLDLLLEKAAAVLNAYGEPAKDVFTAINNLTELDVIASPAYWRRNYGVLKHLETLLRALGGCGTAGQIGFIQEIQAAVGIEADGIAGLVLLKNTPTVSAARKDNPEAVIHAVQRYLYGLGYVEVGQADGIAGGKFDQAVRNFQADHGCVIDGEITAGAKTWRKLLGME